LHSDKEIWTLNSIDLAYTRRIQLNWRMKNI